MRKARFTKPRAWAPIAFVALAIAYWLVAIDTPLHVGLWQDDATYVATARSMADGTGYRHIQLPGEPLQTHYPPLYSALLALGFRLAPDYPENLPWLLIPNALGAAALVVMSVLYWRRVFGASNSILICAGMLSAMSPVLSGFVRYTMSDLAYGGLTVSALYLLDRRAIGSDSQGAPPDRMWVLGAVLVGLAVLTRGIGITLLAALPLVLMLRRRFVEAAATLAIGVMIVLPWWIWQSWASEQNGPLQLAFLTAAELNYGLWAPEDPMQSLRVIQQNGLRVVHDLAYYQLALPIGPATEAVARFGAGTVMLFVVCFAAMALCITGFVMSLREGIRTLHVYALLYAGLMLVWPFEPHRFLVPWTPFLLYFMLTGLDRFLEWVGGASSATAGMAKWHREASIGVALIVAIGFGVENARIIGSRADRYFLRELPSGLDLREIDEVYDWVREHVAENDVFAAAWPAGLFLNTGHQGHFLWPDSDPYARYYGSDRKAWRFYGARSESELMSIHEEMVDRFVATYVDAQIRYYLHQPHWLEALVMGKIIEGNPRIFTQVFESSKGNYRVYRIRFNRIDSQRS